MYSVFIIGCGDIGQRVATLWQQREAKVSALTRSDSSHAKLQTLNIQTYAGDLDQPEALTNLPLNNSLVYYFAPPPQHGIVDQRVRNFINSLTSNQYPKRLVYISTSGVYGNAKGEWVTEETKPNPTTDRSRRRLYAETVLQAWGTQHNIPIVILRVPGIYGSDRLPVEVIKQGRPMLREEESPFTNRIHAVDLARICVAAGEFNKPVGIYNVSDGNPGTMAQYFNAVADLMGLPRPPAVSWNEAKEHLSPAMMSYLTESRRIDNRKMLRDFNLTLLYPTLQDGLTAC